MGVDKEGYYTLRDILGYNCKVNIVLSDRGRGKSTELVRFDTIASISVKNGDWNTREAFLPSCCSISVPLMYICSLIAVRIEC